MNPEKHHNSGLKHRLAAITLPKWLRNTLHAIAYVFSILIFLLGTTIVILNIPTVQTQMVSLLATRLSEALKYPITIEYVNLRWFDTIVLKGVKAEDKRHNRMIYIAELKADFKLSALLQRNLEIEKGLLNGADVYLEANKTNGELNINEFIDAIDLLANPKRLSSKNPPIIKVSQILIKNSRCIYNDAAQDSIKDRFDYLHMTYAHINAMVTNFRVHADTIEMQITDLNAIETGSQIKIKRINTFFRNSTLAMEFFKLKANIGNTYISNYLEMRCKARTDFQDFNNKISILYKSDSSSIAFSDIAKFAPPNTIGRFKEKVFFAGILKGQIRHLISEDFLARFGKTSFLEGSADLEGLPNWDATLLDIRVRNSQIYATDLHQYQGPQTRKLVDKFRKGYILGTFQGYPSKFRATASIVSEVGYMEGDVNLHLDKILDKSTYQGRLYTKDLNVGSLYEDNALFQKLDMDGNISGMGFSAKKANFYLNATIHKFGINGYNYRNIVTDAKLATGQFEGGISAKDSNISLDASGKLDIRDSFQILQFKANLKNANLRALNISKRITKLSTLVDINTIGLNIDNLRGEALFKKTTAIIDNQVVEADSVFLQSTSVAQNRKIKVRSDFLDLDLIGNFKFRNLVSSLAQSLEEYNLYFLNDQVNTVNYYRNKGRQFTHDFTVDYKLDIKNAHQLFNVFTPTFSLANKTKLAGNFRWGKADIFRFKGLSDTINLGNNHFYKNDIDIVSAKVADSMGINAAIIINSKAQLLQGAPSTENLDFSAHWKNKRIDFNGSVYQKKSTNRININGIVDFYPGSYQINLLNGTQLVLLDKLWKVSDSNSIAVLPNTVINLSNLAFSSDSESVALNGRLSVSPTDSVLVDIKNFGLGNFNSISDYKLGGRVDANLILKSALNLPDLYGKILISRFTLDNYLVGDIVGKSIWNNNAKTANVDVDVVRNGKNILTLIGNYKPTEKENSLALKARFNNASLKLLDSFLGKFISGWDGDVSGEVDVKGVPSHPIFEGEGYIKNGTFKYNYINTTYTFSDKVKLSDGLFQFDGVQLKDVNNNVATIKKGRITHNNFQDFGLDIDADLQSFQVLNTTPRQNKIYSGAINATGDLLIKGKLTNLLIKADLASAQGTTMVIPVQDTEDEVTQNSYITFSNSKIAKLDYKDTTASGADFSGVLMDFNLNINQNADCSIILNPSTTKDKITGRGNGKIKITIDTRGEFAMVGTYVFNNGLYDFKYGNLVSKKFLIASGSTITFNGSPLNGIANINATHTLVTSIKPLIDTLSYGSATYKLPEAQRNYPVDINMNITGDLLQPNVAFGIKIRNYPSSLAPVVTSFEGLTASNEQELNKQVSSLIIIKQFIPAGIAGSTLIAGGANNITELFSNQISGYLSEVDPNLQVNINVNGITQQAANAVQVSLSYSLANGRLRISRDGSFTNSTNQTTANSLAGDWTVEYLLRKDGVLRLRMFYKNNQNAISTGLNNNLTTSQGFSFLFTKSFNHIADLFKPKTKEAILNSPSVVTTPALPANQDAMVPENRVIITPDSLRKKTNP